MVFLLWYCCCGCWCRWCWCRRCCCRFRRRCYCCFDSDDRYRSIRFVSSSKQFLQTSTVSKQTNKQTFFHSSLSTLCVRWHAFVIVIIAFFSLSLFPCFVYYFLHNTILLNYRRRNFAAASFHCCLRDWSYALLLSRTVDRARARLADASIFPNRTEDRTRPRLLLHPFLIEEPCRSSLMRSSGHSFNGMAHTYACCCILFRTGDRSDAGSRLLLHYFEHDGYLNLNNQRKWHIWYLSSVLLHFCFPISFFSFSLLLHL